VGASRGDISKLTFLVAWNLNDIGAYSACTGTLLTKRWVLSAAHCITNILDTKDIDKCVSNTKVNGEYQVHKGHYSDKVIKCIYTKNKDVKIYPITPKGAAYVGIEDVANHEAHNLGQKILIEFVVRHFHSYRGGGSYGRFGGYDITLIHLEEDAAERPACLPSVSLKDSGIGRAFKGTEKVSLAGFGKYMREPCITDGNGASKYHYCNSDCNITDFPPQSEPCKTFFGNKNTPDRVPELLKEIIITDRDNDNKKHYCYRQVPPYFSDSKGWCHVNHDASEMGNMYEEHTWGFCSKDCFLEEEKEPDSFVLRKRINVDILEEDMCQQFLKISLYNKTKVMPEILCIGYLERFRYQHWIKKNGRYRRGRKRIAHQHEISTGSGQYVRSAGTCNGDSGGPVFIYDDESGDYVVLGAVSGGRGVLGKCGGMNNPTHYTRSK